MVNLNLIKREKIKDILENSDIKDHYRSLKSSKKEQPRLSERFITLAIKAFQMGRISKGKLAEYLEIQFSEVSSFLTDRGYNENEDYSHEITVA